MLQETVIAVGVPLNKEQNQALFLLSPLEGLQEVVYNIRNLTIQITLGAVFLSLLISYFMTRNIVKPVQKIKNRAHRMAEGDLSVRLKKLPGDEIGDLGKSFNYMAEALVVDFN